MTLIVQSAAGYDKLQTQMSGLGTVVAMPQWYINFNLANLLAHGQTTDGKSLQNVQLVNGQHTFLTGVIARIWTQVYVPGSAQKVKFILSFKSGTLDYWDIDQDPPVKKQADITGLQYGFDVDLNRSDVQDNQNLPAPVKQRVLDLLSNLGQGAFTVQQLFMDFENATLSQYDPSATIFPSNFPDSAATAFSDYLRTYLKGLSGAGGNILGYAIRVHNPGGKDDPVATFPPTDLQFATNRYTPSQSPGPNDWRPDLDTIDYQMMTGGGTFPTNLPVWSGNFVVPADDASGWYGAIAMAQQLFVQQFLLPRLSPLVTQYWRLKDRSGSLDINYDTATGALISHGLGGAWNSGQTSGHSHQTNTWSNDDAYYNMTFDVQVNITPGSNQIVIQRNTNFDIEFVHWYGVEGGAAKSRFKVWYAVPLTITVTLQGVQDGNLVVAVASQTTQPDPNIGYGDPYGWLITQTDGDSSIWQSVSKTMDAMINSAVNAAMPEALLPGITQVITKDLNLSPFVFPGGAQLFMANPMFNNEGDLLLGLQYKR